MTAETLAGPESRSELDRLAEQVDTSIRNVRALDPAAQDTALAMKTAIEEFHKRALTTIVQRLKADPRGKELLFELAGEPHVYSLFLMHGLVRPDPRTRASRVIDLVRPYMQSHGGDVELVDVKGHTAYVKLIGACNGCSMSAVTLRNGVEDALKEHVPEISMVEVVPNEPAPALIPLSSVTARLQPGWITGPHVADLPEGKPYCMDTERGGILIIKLGDRIQAFRNACAHQGLPLEGGIVDGEAGTITCPWHGFRYDCVTGECLTSPQAQLEAFPLRVENGVVKVRPS